MVEVAGLTLLFPLAKPPLLAPANDPLLRLGLFRDDGLADEARARTPVAADAFGSKGAQASESMMIKRLAIISCGV